MSEFTLTQYVERLREERLRCLKLLAEFSSGDLDVVSQIRGRTLRGMLWMMEEHYRVHRTQIHNNRIAADERPTELNVLLAQCQASFEAVLTLLIGLSEAGASQAPAEGEWSVHQVLDHLLEFEQRYRREFERLLAEKASAVKP